MQIELVKPKPVPEEQKITGTLVPTGYRILLRILPPTDDEKLWHDLLHLPGESRDREWQAQLWGLVEDLGPDAYADEKRYPNGPWCKKGDTVMMRPYSGTRFRVENHLYALINDDTVCAVVTGDPRSIERA